MSLNNEFANVTALVVGDVMLDRYWQGAANRISPEAPVPVVRINDMQTRPGAAANVAINLASLECQVRLCGIVGDDEAGNLLKDDVVAAGVANTLLSGASPTIVKLRVMSQNQQLLRADFEEPVCKQDSNLLLTKFYETLSSTIPDVVILSDYDKGSLITAPQMIDHAKQLGVPVLVDPKGSDFAKYHGATMMTPNRKELEAVVGKCTSLTELFERARKLVEEIELDAIVVTLSEDGMALIGRDKTVHVGAEAREVFDVTGAGDTVIATLAASIGARMPVQRAINLANTAAGIAVGKLGTASVTVAELRQHSEGSAKSDDAIPVSKEKLKADINAIQSKGGRVVLTNGCFDLLHPGHIRYLEQAAELGDHLIVAVNSDNSVARLKGSGRPINPLHDRMQMLAALKPVGSVFSFDEDTPAELIAYLLPDILVKGGDYEVHEIAGGDAVIANGGEVRSLSFVEGYSSTNLINEINRQSDPE